MIPRLPLLAAVLLSLAATPGLAQGGAETGMRGMREARIAAGLQGTEATRAHCRVPEGAEADAFEQLRALAESVGLRVPPGSRTVRPNPAHVVAASVGLGAEQPLLVLNYSVVTRTEQPDSPCAASLILQLRARAVGQVRGGGRLDGPVALWHDDAVAVAAPAETLQLMRDQLRTAGARFVAAFRAEQQQPGGGVPGASGLPKAPR